MPCFSWACLQAQGAGGATQAVPSHAGPPPRARGWPPSPHPLQLTAHHLIARRPEIDVEVAHCAWSCSHTILGKEALEDTIGR